MLLDLTQYPRLARGLKLLSTGLMLVALGLAGARLFGPPSPWIAPLEILFWLTSLAAIAHGVEALIAGTRAARCGDNGFKAGFYTFFTGFVGLSETLRSHRDPSDLPLKPQ